MQPIAFGTDGWRGITGFDFTFERAILVCEAIWQFLIEENRQSQLLIISHDTRFLAPELALRIASYLLSRGCKVCLIRGFTPTPVTAFAVSHLDSAGAIMLTASHNPYYYLGLKFIPHYAGPADTEITDRISEIVSLLTKEGFSPPASISEPECEFIDVSEDYFNHIEKLINGASIKTLHARVLYSPFYGCGQGYVSGFLKRYGIEIHRVHIGRDVLFGGLLPDPSPGNLNLLLPLLKEKGIPLAVATDGDADRFGMINAHGQYFGANQVLPLLADFLLSVRRERGALVRTVVTSHLLDDVAKEHKVALEETKVGFKFVGKRLREGALIGGEESGGISIRGHVPEKDGILSILLALEMIATSGMPIEKLYQELVSRHHPYVYERIDLRLPDEPADKLMSMVEQALEDGHAFGQAVARVNSLDGIKFILDDGSWVAFRKSGTESVVRVYLEGIDEPAFNSLKKHVKRFLREIAPVK